MNEFGESQEIVERQYSLKMGVHDVLAGTKELMYSLGSSGGVTILCVSDWLLSVDDYERMKW